MNTTWVVEVESHPHGWTPGSMLVDLTELAVTDNSFRRRYWGRRCEIRCVGDIWLELICVLIMAGVRVS